MRIRLSYQQIADAQQAVWKGLPWADHSNIAGSCWACGDGSEALERAHIVARAHGGSNEATNLLLLCSICHFEHPDSLPFETQLLWLRTRESHVERKTREARKTIEALRMVGSEAELETWCRQRGPLNDARAAATRPHTLAANATWCSVSDFLNWKAAQAA